MIRLLHHQHALSDRLSRTCSPETSGSNRTSSISCSTPAKNDWRACCCCSRATGGDRKSTRLNSSHGYISYAVFCLKKKKKAHEGKSEPHFATSVEHLHLLPANLPEQEQYDVAIKLIVVTLDVLRLVPPTTEQLAVA